MKREDPYALPRYWLSPQVEVQFMAIGKLDKRVVGDSATALYIERQQDEVEATKP